MSYILDALKKADAERVRGAVPGLHTQQAPSPASEPDDRRSGAWLPVATAAGGVAVALAAAWWWWGREQPAPAVVASAPAPAHMPAPAPAPAPVVTPEAPAPTQVAPVEPAAVVAQTPPPPPPAPAVTPVVPAPQVAAPAPAPAAPPEPRQPARPETRNATAPAQAPAPIHVDPAATPRPRILSFAELPESVRRELPPMNIGGAMHSDTPSNRMLILNSGVYHEGDQPAPGLILEEIRLKSAVFRYRDYRYSVTY